MRRFSIFLLLALFLGACGTEPQTGVRAEVEDLQLTRHPDGDQVVTGTLVNQSERAVRGAQIEVSLYDEENRPLETVRIDVQNVEPGERRPFRRVLDAPFVVQGAGVKQILIF
jgi:hypothetical protein